MAETFRKLKELAVEAGTGPEPVASAYQTFLTTGRLGSPKEGARKKLGLDPLPASGGESLARVLADDEGDED